jgi:hypothetical protein
MRKESLVLALLVTASFAARAEEPAAGPLPCSLVSALGQKFGATQINGEVAHTGPNSVLLAPSVEFPPFRNIEVGISPRSHRIWGVSGNTTFGDLLRAKAFGEALIRRFEAELPIKGKETDPEAGTTILFTGQGKDCSRVSERKGCTYHDGLRIEVRVSDSRPDPPTVFLSCDDLTLEAIHFKEVWSDRN